VGLLSRSQALKEGEGASRGLLARASALRMGARTFDAAPPATGLLRRALAIRESVRGLRARATEFVRSASASVAVAEVKPETQEPIAQESIARESGLLARASRAQEEAPRETTASAAIEPEMPPAEPTLPEPEPPEEPSFVQNTGPDTDQTYWTRPEMEAPNLEEPVGASPFEEVAEASADEMSFELPESVADAFDEETDPFTEWKAEASEQVEEKWMEKPAAKTAADPFLFADEGVTTVPEDQHIASQKKIDNYLALFDITREINALDSLDDLWDAVLYAILGQMGADSIAIFAGSVQDPRIFEPVAATGLDLKPDWILSPNDPLYESLSEKEGVRYAAEFDKQALSPVEREIIDKGRFKIFAPLWNHGAMYGVVMLGDQLSGDDYAVEDLEYLTLLGAVAAAGLDRLRAREEFSLSTRELRRRTELHQQIFDFSRATAAARSLDELYDLLLSRLQKIFAVESFSLVLLNPAQKTYRIFGGNAVSPETMDKFVLSSDSELVSMISNVTHLYEVTAFRENAEILSCYTNDDLSLMQQYWILPLINLNWLVGFVTIHRLARPWDNTERELAVTMVEIMAPAFANAIILKERESIFRDPFSPLEDRLRYELDRAREFNAPLCLLDFRVKNIKRLLTLNAPEEMSRFLLSLNRAISGFLLEGDFMTRVGQGRFAILLPGRTKAEAGIFSEKLQSELRRLRLMASSPLEAQYSCRIHTNQEIPRAEQMLALME